MQLQANYTFANAEDNAPLAAYVVGSADDRLSDPSSVDRDQGKTPFYQRHTFVLSSVLAPRVAGAGLGAALANNNQLGLIVQWNSGLPFNIRSNRDLNQDGLQNDRPNGISRNTGRLGRVLNVDARYSRFVALGRRVRAELFAEAKNLFDTENVASVNRVVQVDPLGNLMAALPAEFPGTGGYHAHAELRQLARMRRPHHRADARETASAEELAAPGRDMVGDPLVELRSAVVLEQAAVLVGSANQDVDAGVGLLARVDERLDGVRAEVGVHGDRVARMRAFEEGSRIRRRRRVDVAALDVANDEQPGFARGSHDALPRERSLGAVELEESGLRLHGRNLAGGDLDDRTQEVRASARLIGPARARIADGGELLGQARLVRVEPDETGVAGATQSVLEAIGVVHVVLAPAEAQDGKAEDPKPPGQWAPTRKRFAT